MARKKVYFYGKSAPVPVEERLRRFRQLLSLTVSATRDRDRDGNNRQEILVTRRPAPAG